MKINYEKIKGRAIIPLDSYNLHELIMAFVNDGKLPITKESIHSGNEAAYNTWCHFLHKIRFRQQALGSDFAIALDENVSEGVIYGDVYNLEALGYKPITLTEALEIYPNMSIILGVNPDESLESKGLLPLSPFAPHRVCLDGVIRCNNDGCPADEEVIDILTNAKFITDEHNGLYDLFGLSDKDYFSIKGHSYEGFSSANNFAELLAVCENNTGLIYELINYPDRIQIIASLEEEPAKQPPMLEMH